MEFMNDSKREPTETLGERLRRLRKERGLSQQSISGPGLTTAHISRIEAGLRRPSVRAIRALAKQLDVTPEYLETGTQLGPRGDLELRVADAELELRIGTARPEATVENLQSLISEARALGDPLITARAVAALGVALSATSSYAQAIPLLEEAIASSSITATLRPDVFLALARAHSAAGRLAESISVLEASLEFVREHATEHVGAYMRFAVHLSYALTDAGRFDEARAVLEKAMDEHADECDQRAQVSSYWTLARIAAMSGETPVALDHMRRAIALLEADEDALALAKTEGAYGQILVLDGRFEEARGPLDKCVRTLELAGRSDDLGLFVTDQAICAAELGDVDEAERLANKALGLLEQSPREQGGAIGALAVTRAIKKDATGAEPLFARAVDLLEQDSQFEEAGRFCRAWASLLLGEGRREEAAGLTARADGLEKRVRPRTRRPSS
jgi:tetratricopeptide (TPR) repeat protein